MTLQSSKTIFVAGTLLISLWGWLLMVSAPMPGGLSSAHEAVAELSAQGGCQQCHAKAGLTAGCLHCHAEIKKQLADGVGYHAFLLKGKEVSCAGCHKEHSGPEFPLINASSWGPQVARAFKHPQARFFLEGKHSRLTCEQCHKEKRQGPFTLPGFASLERSKTHLGLRQDCKACHKDIHSSGLTPACGTCHGQEVFKPPAHFDHSQHFPLIGGHTGLECKGCHVLPDPSAPSRPFPFPFEDTRGTTCAQCHQKPHFAAAFVNCDDCHLAAAPQWSDAIQNVPAEKHAITGFRLLGAHVQVECAKCHPRNLPFAGRYHHRLEPGYLRTEDTCQGCHRDVHEGQFRDRHSQCLDCHERLRFLPSTFGHEAHAVNYALTGAHLAVACTGCHQRESSIAARKFSGTSHVCKDCHAYPHGEQFQKEIAQGDCTVCHHATADSFQIRPFDHEKQTTYPLVGGHAEALCNDCHVETPEGSGPKVRKYRGNPRQCGACHRDVHRGQFQKDGRTACATCHLSFYSWKTLEFNHNTMSRFPLEGAHALAACSRCHKLVKLPDESEIVQYKPLGVECRDCHEIAPGTTSIILR